MSFIIRLTSAWKANFSACSLSCFISATLSPSSWMASSSLHKEGEGHYVKNHKNLTKYEGLWRPSHKIVYMYCVPVENHTSHSLEQREAAISPKFVHHHDFSLQTVVSREFLPPAPVVQQYTEHAGPQSQVNTNCLVTSYTLCTKPEHKWNQN